MLSIKQILNCFYKAGYDTVYHDGIEHAGYLAFLAILSLFPFLVFFFAIVGFFGQSEIGLAVIDSIVHNELIPSNILSALEPRLKEIASGPPQGLLTIAIIGAIWTASSAVEGIRTTLNRAYRVTTPPAYIWRRLMSIVEFFGLTFILTLVTFILIVGPNIWNHVSEFLYLKDVKNFFTQTNVSIPPMWDYIRYFTSGLIMFLIVSSLYIILPNTWNKLRDVAPGSAIVVILWFIAGSLLSGYISNVPQVNIIYGSLGGIIAALLFFYITAMIFIFGAEFNYTLSKALGRKVKKKE